MPVQPLKSYRGSGGSAPVILSLGTRRRWVVSLMLRSLDPWERILVPVDPQSVWDMWGREKNILHRKALEPQIVKSIANTIPVRCRGN